MSGRERWGMVQYGIDPGTESLLRSLGPQHMNICPKLGILAQYLYRNHLQATMALSPSESVGGNFKGILEQKGRDLL